MLTRRLSMPDEEKNQLVKQMRNDMLHLDRESQYWTNEERDHLAEMFSQGRGITEIALELRRSEGAVFQQAKLMGLYHKIRNRCPKPACCLCPICAVQCDCLYRTDIAKDGGCIDAR